LQGIIVMRSGTRSATNFVFDPAAFLVVPVRVRFPYGNEGPTARASAEAVNSMRAKIAEMKAKHNKFVQENGLRLELFPE